MTMDYLLLIIGLALGALIGYLVANKKNQVPTVNDDSLILELRANQQQTSQDLQSERAQKESLIAQLSKQQQLQASLQERLNEEEKRAEEMRQRFAVEFQNLANKIF